MRRQGLAQIVLAASLMLFVPRVWADDTQDLKEQVQALQNRVNQLEAQLGNNQQSVVAAPATVYDQWEDPFTQMMLMRQQMERNMHQAFADSAVFSPRMDIKQTDKDYVVTMDIPGMDKNKIDIEIKQGMLIISGERRSESEDNKNNQYYQQERSFGTFTQAIPLPDDSKKDQVQAKYENGVLTVHIARVTKEEKKNERIKVE